MANELKIGDIVQYINDKKRRGIIIDTFYGPDKSLRQSNYVHWFKERGICVYWCNELKKVEK